MEYYTKHRNAVCSDCRRRLERNPLRLLDCKKPSCVPLTEQAPNSTDHLCSDCSDHFSRLSSYLRLLNLPFVTNHRLVRGLDYYTKTVFEIAPEGEESAQATVDAGGRYDDLIEQLGGRPTPAIGFATGIERLILNMKKQKIIVPQSAEPFVFVAHISQQAKDEAMKLTSLLRRSGISVIPSLGDRSLKAQLKQANSMGANKAVIIGEDEAKSGTVVLRDMAKGEQNIVPRDVVVETLRKT